MELLGFRASGFGAWRFTGFEFRISCEIVKGLYSDARCPRPGNSATCIFGLVGGSGESACVALGPCPINPKPYGESGESVCVSLSP